MQIHTPGGGIGSPPPGETAAKARVSTARVGRTRKYIMVMSWERLGSSVFEVCQKQLDLIRPQAVKGLNRPADKNKTFEYRAWLPRCIRIDFHLVSSSTNLSVVQLQVDNTYS